MKKSQLLASSRINQNYQHLQQWMQHSGREALVLTSFDLFFNEYVPLEECHRYLLSGFSGSVGLFLMLAKGKSRVYVDGRYYEQADKEINHNNIEVVKVPFGKALEVALIEDLQNLNLTQLWVEEDRTPHQLVENLEKICSVAFVKEGEIKKQISASGWVLQDKVIALASDWSGQSIKGKLQQALKKDEALFCVALDQIAWLLNWRGNQLPCQQTFMSKVFATQEKIHLFIDQTVIPPQNYEPEIEIHVIDWSHWQFGFENFLQSFSGREFKSLWFDPAQIGEGDFLSLQKKFAQQLSARTNGLNFLMNLKNSAELKAFEESFERADCAIYESLQWLIKQAEQAPTEFDFAQQTWKNYQAQGARDLSFKTIAGFGANSSIIHYSVPSQTVKLKKGELALLDSGGLFEYGMATDCTRTVLPLGEATAQQKELYTLVLKGLLSVMGAVFPSGTPGSYLDSLARYPIRQGGYEYAHGTGHGVGVNVHEAGYSLNPLSKVPLLAGRVGSVEPGIYLPGVGGVRLENIMIVEQRDSRRGVPMLGLKSLVKIGFFWPLIDLELLTKDEMKTFMDYERLCFNCGRSFAPAGTF